MNYGSENNSKFLVVKAKGGMGNCMLCAVTGILYGQLTERKIIVDWRDESYSNDGSNTFSRFFDAPQVFPETILPKNASIRPEIWAGQLHKSMSAMISEYDPNKHSSIFIHRKYSVDVRKLEYDENILVFWYPTEHINALRKHLQNPEYGFSSLNKAQIIRKVFREQMYLPDEIQQRIADFKAKNWHDVVIGLHIRHTDRRTKLVKYERPLMRFLKCNPKAFIFLSTDNRKVSEDYHRRYKNVFSTPKWFPDGFSSMHQNRTCPDKVANGIEALVDMYLLADCDYLIYPGSSTFSWISRLLSDMPSERVVDTERFDPKVRLKRWIRERVV